jgi:hypothetical protein
MEKTRACLVTKNIGVHSRRPEEAIPTPKATLPILDMHWTPLISCDILDRSQLHTEGVGAAQGTMAGSIAVSVANTSEWSWLRSRMSHLFLIILSAIHLARENHRWCSGISGNITHMLKRHSGGMFRSSLWKTHAKGNIVLILVLPPSQKSKIHH